MYIMYTYTYMCAICMYVCMYVCMYIYIYIHSYIHIYTYVYVIYTYICMPRVTGQLCWPAAVPERQFGEAS